MTTLREAAQQALGALEGGADSWQLVGPAIDALRAALAEPCPCGDRPAAQCPGEWEPGCDLGNNPKYAKRLEMTPKELAASIKRGEKWKVAEPVLNPAPGYCKHCKQYTIEEPLPAEPLQAPVAWIYADPDKPGLKFLEWREDAFGYEGEWIKTPLYAAPLQSKP